MEPPPLDAAAAAAARSVGAAPELLALVFERLPPVEQCVTVSRLAREWRRWASSRREQLLAAIAGQPLADRTRQPPRWCYAEAWPRLSDRQRSLAARRASACGDVERLQWLRAQAPPCPWETETCELAAEHGHLDVLRWLRAQDPPCPWHELTCCYAAAEGHLDVLRWLRAQDPPCPWAHLACCDAAANGHLDVLRWLRAQDPPCPWGEGACLGAARHGHLDVLRWLRAQDPPCPWDKAACKVFARGADVRTWIDTQPEDSPSDSYSF
jgi:hypothetical protein